MTKLYPISSLTYTIFERPACIKLLEENNIIITDNIKEADIFISKELKPNTLRNYQTLLNKNGVQPKPLLVWTHEPRFARTDVDHIEIEDFCQIYVMNLYTRNVYFSNLTFYGRNIDRLLEPVSDASFAQTPIAGLATYVPGSQDLVINDVNIDLVLKRQNLLLEGFNNGQIDIYGRYWPNGIAIAESRGQGWQMTKLEILKNYQFNIAIENTAFDNYCTEKIWDSIKSYCLPIYSSFNNKIYDLFPKNSFIDYDDFKSNSDLLLYLKNISQTDYLDRLNLCIETFNNIYQTTNIDKEREKAFYALLNKINQIIE